MANLPYELFYQIALHLPSTKDVLTFTLTHSRVRKALSTPVLFKERLALQGWDVSAWQDEDSNAASGAQSPRGDLGRWMRIDHVYCRTVQLFDEATADDYFSESPPDVPRNPVPGGQKTMVWLRKLSEVLPAFLSHHRAFPGALICHVLLFRTKKMLAFQVEETSYELPKQDIAVLS